MKCLLAILALPYVLLHILGDPTVVCPISGAVLANTLSAVCDLLVFVFLYVFICVCLILFSSWIVFLSRCFSSLLFSTVTTSSRGIFPHETFRSLSVGLSFGVVLVFLRLITFERYVFLFQIYVVVLCGRLA